MYIRGTIYGMLASAILCAVLWGLMAVTYDLTEARMFVITGGSFFWIIVWGIGGAIIGEVASRYKKPKIAGLLYGMGAGAITGEILIVWPYCSQPFDPTPQQILISIGMPAIFFHELIFGSSNLNASSTLFLSSSVTLWALWGVLLAVLIKRKGSQGAKAGITATSNDVVG